MRLIAHGCGPTVYPSNTIFSAREALKNGADLVELDLQFTKDKRIAVFHDSDLMKKFGDPRKCREVTAEEFLSLRNTKDPACPTHLLDHFFQCGIAPILLHLPRYIVPATLELVEEYNYGDKVFFGVGDVESLTLIRSRLPDAKVLAFMRDPVEIEAFGENGADFMRLWERWLTKENIDRVKKTGAEFWIMTGGPETDFPVGRPDRKSLERFMELKPDGLLVNNIPFVKSVLAELE